MVNLNDILVLLVFSHCRHVSNVLQQLQVNNLYRKMEKCASEVPEKPFLGYIILEHSLHKYIFWMGPYPPASCPPRDSWDSPTTTVKPSFLALLYPDFPKPVLLEVKASFFGFRVILLQFVAGQKWACVFILKKFSPELFYW